ncbi:MAG: gliding motility-associated C-terminal domain-containing protein [Bacteroidetes bacterium]|nr:gliding motility-associated C-terminal domain-containing protein [Bacteroidota bacterium]
MIIAFKLMPIRSKFKVKSDKGKILLLQILALILILVHSHQSNGQPSPPSLRCISVGLSGAVTLNWIPPIDTGTVFGGYHVSYSTNTAGPFLPVDSIFNYNTLTTTINSVNANNTVLFFYIKTRAGCCTNYSVPSDTLRTMRMIVTPLSNESVKLNWNRIHTPPLPTTLANYIVSKELTSGAYTTFRTTTDTTTSDTNIFCSKFINYKVIQGDASGCQSTSSIDGELFRDTKGPAKPLLDTVSINLISGDVQISWFPDSSADTDGYVIYEFNGSSYDSIGAVYGINTLSFTYPLTNSATVVETFSIAAFDTCRNLGSLAANHKTMLLNLSYEKCGALASLNWTPYENLKDGISRYEIWVRENSGNWVRDAFVPSTVFNYEKILTNQGSLYEFVIRVVGVNGQTASSNIKSIIADIFIQPQFLYIKSLDVRGSGVEVNCYVDPGGDIVSYRLYRSNFATGSFTFVDEKNYTASNTITFLDAFAGADQQQKFYKISATDSCVDEQLFSNVSGTVLLSAEGGNDYISDLSWIDYFGWQGTTGYFNIYRVIDGFTASQPFATVSGDTLFFREDVSSFPAGDGNICYVVQAVEKNQNSFGFRDSSISNIACAPQSANAYIPNAFTPGGKNPIFKPYLLFADPENYSLQIYNRWGQQVFASTQPDLGWNGQFESKNAPTGLYVYILIFKGFNKKELRRTGTISLLR